MQNPATGRWLGFAVVVTTILLGSGCAHTPIPTTAMDGYFTCRGTTLDQAESSLAGDGWPIQNKTDHQITTDWRPIAMSGAASMMTGGARYVVRLVVAKVGESLNFRVYQALGGSQAGLQGTAQREAEWRPIYDSQVKDEEARKQLNSFRRAICGGREYFSGNEDYLKPRPR